jgi:hypothetical protein
MRRQNLTCLSCGYLKLGDDGDCLDLLAPWELDVVADAERRRWRTLTGIHTACRGRKDLAQRDFHPRNVLGGERLQVCTNKASEESSSDIVRVTFYPSCQQHCVLHGTRQLNWLFVLGP